MKYSQLPIHAIGIYKINFPNGKAYIGLSNNIKRRIYEHFSDGRNNMLCHKAVLKYFNTIEDLDIEILEEIYEENYKILSDLERKWIEYYHTNDKEQGYNLTSGGIELLEVENPFSKFSADDIKIIYNLLIDGHSNVFIASQFNVHPDTIGKINNGKRYYNSNYNYPLRTITSKERSGFNNHEAIQPEQFEQIVDLLKHTNLTNEQIAQQVGVYRTTISKINQGKVSYCPSEWKYPLRINNQNKTRLSENDILNIHKLLQQGYTTISIANEYHCSRDTISDIKNGKRHRISGVKYPIKP